jgi:hypothetical protein
MAITGSPAGPQSEEGGAVVPGRLEGVDAGESQATGGGGPPQVRALGTVAPSCVARRVTYDFPVNPTSR